MSRALVIVALLAVGACAKPLEELAPFPCAMDGRCPQGFQCTPERVCCAPAAETCNGVDDDCDGEIDEDEGKLCGTEEVCTASGCGCPDRCGERCVDLARDPRNCGACGVACGGLTDRCQDGRCTCAEGLLTCGEACVDPGVDRANCGGCGQACSAGQTCVQGACGCSPMATHCDGACVDLQTNPEHCGACGRACDPVFPTAGGTDACVQGQCRPETVGAGGPMVSFTVASDVLYRIDYADVSISKQPLNQSGGLEALDLSPAVPAFPGARGIAASGDAIFFFAPDPQEDELRMASAASGLHTRLDGLAAGFGGAPVQLEHVGGVLFSLLEGSRVVRSSVPLVDRLSTEIGDRVVVTAADAFVRRATGIVRYVGGAEPAIPLELEDHAAQFAANTTQLVTLGASQIFRHDLVTGANTSEPWPQALPREDVLEVVLEEGTGTLYLLMSQSGLSRAYRYADGQATYLGGSGGEGRSLELAGNYLYWMTDGLIVRVRK